MAAVIHSLWEKGDRSPLILPSSIPIDDPRVQFELTRYLLENWVPVIEKDVDGPGSLPARLAAEVSWQAIRLQGNERLAVRASKKLRNEELLLTGFAGTRLRMELDRVPLWRGNHVEVRQLVEAFARYLYLPRLKSPAVLVQAVRGGLAIPSWEVDSFAYADSFDEVACRYRGLRAPQDVNLTDENPTGLLVKPDAARSQMYGEGGRSDAAPWPCGGTTAQGGPGGRSDRQRFGRRAGRSSCRRQGRSQLPRRFYGSVVLDSERMGRDAGRIAEEVIAHFVGLGAQVTVTLEIEATLPSGIPDHVVRAVTENARTLKFKTQAFEAE